MTRQRQQDDGGAPAPEAEGDAREDPPRAPATAATRPGALREQPPGEIGGPKGPEPTRYGDWERGGRCTDF